MTGEGTGRSGVIGLLASLAIHLSLAAILVWPSGQRLQAGWGEAHAATAGADRLQRSVPSARPRPDTLDSTGQIAAILMPRLADALPVLPDAAGWLDHLWQSTIFAGAAGLLTVVFRRNGAHVRYWLWFSASLKFFVPFAMLPALGRVAWAPPVSSVAILVVWAIGFAAIALIRLRMWRRIRAAVRASTPLELPDVAVPPGVLVRSAPGLLEPGVAGWRRPILLMPADIQRHLTQPQLATIVAHELSHIRRHDNLTAAMHMVAEAIFWFHPLVWLIGARLVDERERACDEDVLRAFGDPPLYAQAILNVCKRYVESPLACVSGVGGSSIARRIDAILRNEVGEALGPVKKIVLGAALVVAVIIPVGAGTLNGPRLRPQNAPQPADVTLDAAARAEVIDGALAALDDGYVFPDVAKKMAEAIRARQQRKEYDAITSGREFAQVLTEHLREVSHDRHLRVDFIQQGPPPPPPPAWGPDARRPAADDPGAPELRLRPRRAAGRQHRLPGPARIHAAGDGWRNGHRSDDVSRQHRRGHRRPASERRRRSDHGRVPHQLSVRAAGGASQRFLFPDVERNPSVVDAALCSGPAVSPTRTSTSSPVRARSRAPRSSPTT